MRRHLTPPTWRTAATILLAVLALAATDVAAARSAPAACVKARIDGERKCLQRGQFCKQRSRGQYPRYGFRCVKRGERYRLIMLTTSPAAAAADRAG